MARTASPWFWEERNGWYVNRNGQRHFLGDHPEGSPPPRKIKGKWNVPQPILQAFHALMARREAVVPKTSPNGPTAVEVFDKYLDWCRKHREPRTFEWYRDHIQGFLDFLKDKASMPLFDLKPFHVVEWADAHPDWSPAYRKGAIIAIQRPFNWAEELGYITASPIKKIKKPQPQRRESHATPEDFAATLERFPEGDPFRDLLQFSWHSGCRPQEAKQIEARHVQLAAECVVIPKEEAKGKRRARVILLHGPALEIIRRLMGQRPTGKLFLNEDGKPWKRFANANRFDRLLLAQGIEALKEAGVEVPRLPRFNRRKFPDKKQLAAARKEHQAKLKERRKEILKLARHLWLGFDLSSPLLICHTCDNPPCFNPDHLFPGTHKVNAGDMVQKGRLKVKVGEDHPRALLDRFQVRRMRLLREVSDLTVRELGAMFGVSEATAKAVIYRRLWKHL